MEKPERFQGFLEDESLRFLCIDYFEKSTYECEAFLLTHHHSDHMSGFFYYTFSRLVNDSENKYVYCSPITAEFLKRDRRNGLKDEKIIATQICKPLILKEVDGTHVVVTAIPAGHCPGSVMFLIEYKDKRILHTGDFRMSLEDFKDIQRPITNADGSVKYINDLYLDTTFAVESKFNDLPAREDSEKVILDLADDWLAKAPDNKLILDIPACIGTEYLYTSLYKRFKKKIIVHPDAYDKFYSQVDEMVMCLKPYDQTCASEWTIHVCNKNDCNLWRSENIKKIKPCVLPFIKNVYQQEGLKFCPKYNVPYFYSGENFIKVLYSSHCSLNELRAIVNFIKPERIFFNTKYGDSKQTMALLRSTSNENENAAPKNNVALNLENIELPKRKGLGDADMEMKVIQKLKLKSLN